MIDKNFYLSICNICLFLQLYFMNKQNKTEYIFHLYDNIDKRSAENISLAISCN